MIGRTNTGGGAGLNFKVVGNPQPETAKENTIWIDTAEINGCAFSAAAPKNPDPGMVWIYTGTSSVVAFNALKKNSVMVYPISAKQYVGGAWVDVSAKSYQGGVWVDWWNGELYTYGNEWAGITGGWYGVNVASNAVTGSSNVVVTKNADYIELRLATDGQKNCMLLTNSPIDLTDFSTVSFTGYISQGKADPNRGAYGYLNIYQDISANSTLVQVARQNISNDGKESTVTIDVSDLNGLHHICPYMYGFDSVGAYLRMRNLILKR